MWTVLAPVLIAAVLWLSTSAAAVVTSCFASAGDSASLISECRVALSTDNPPDDPTPTPTPTPFAVCTPPFCAPDEVFHCPAPCLGGCGTICATPTPDRFCMTPIAIAPTSGPPGTQVDVTGECYLVHSGREVKIYFDALLAADVRGDVDGNYEASFKVPLTASVGSHVVSASLEYETGKATFTVTPPCIGDCGGSGAVSVADLILGVSIALGTFPVSACPAFENNQGRVDIAQIVRAVNNALIGCVP